MRHAMRRTANALVWALVLATAMTACSKSTKPSTADLSSVKKAVGNQDAGGGDGGSGGAGNGGNGSSSSDAAAASGDSSILGDNPGCHLLSASDVKNAVGQDLPALLGNVSGGMQGNTGHLSCTYTADDAGTGADVNVAVNTFPGTAKDQLSELRPSHQDQVDSFNEVKAGSATLRDVSVGDGGYEVDVQATSGYDESVWFTKGDKVVNLEVGGGKVGAALPLAQAIAGKI